MPFIQQLSGANALIRLENLAIALIALTTYSITGASWILFVVLILAPDISMIGYVANPKVGAFTYNLVHNYLLVFLLVAAGASTQNSLFDTLALILAVHIGFDRFLGLGLKYSDAFKPTHMQKV